MTKTLMTCAVSDLGSTLASTKLNCLMTGVMCVCEQLAQSQYVKWKCQKSMLQPVDHKSNVLTSISTQHTL